MAHVSEYDVESLFIDRLESIGYKFVDMANYDDVVANFREQLTAFNARKPVEAKGEAVLSDAEFGRVMIHVDNKSVSNRNDSHGPFGIYLPNGLFFAR